jgi:hypothetical protein
VLLSAAGLYRNLAEFSGLKSQRRPWWQALLASNPLPSHSPIGPLIEPLADEGVLNFEIIVPVCGRLGSPGDNLRTRTMSSRAPKCAVLTGGPCGGKTTLLRELRSEDPHADRWLILPEVAPLLFRAGLNATRCESLAAAVQAQVALEEACLSAMRPGQVLLCHRGALDPLAYWLWRGGDERALLTPLRRAALLHRYTVVLHLQTAAIDAVASYRRWPNAHRPETLAQAAEIDHFCTLVWRDHPHYELIRNTNCTWLEKSHMAKRLLTV